MYYEYEPGHDICGIRYWAAWYRRPAPRFEVFRYMGHNKNTGHYIFKSVKFGDFIARSYYQLNAHDFYPFLIPSGTIQGGN